MKIEEIKDVEVGHYIVANVKFKTFLCRVYSHASGPYIDYFMCEVLMSSKKRRVKIEKTQLAINSEYEVYETMDEVKQLYPEIFI